MIYLGVIILPKYITPKYTFKNIAPKTSFKPILRYSKNFADKHL